MKKQAKHLTSYKGIGGWIRPKSSEDHVGIGMVVLQQGIDHGGDGLVLGVTGEYLAVKWPGSTGWAGIGARSYQPGQINIYRIVANHGAMLQVEAVLEWSTARKKKQEQEGGKP